LSDRASLFWAKMATVMLGILVITYSLLMSGGGEIVLFDAYLIIGSIVGLPIALPLLAALYIRRLPKWSYFFTTGMCLLPSAWSIIQANFFDNPWTIQERSMWVFIFFVLGTVISMPFYRRSSEAYKKQAGEFFTRMRTPVDFEKEIGVTKDYEQLRLMGNTCLIAGALLSSLFILVRAWWEAGCVAFLVGFVVAVGLMLRTGASREKKRYEAYLAAHPKSAGDESP